MIKIINSIVLVSVVSLLLGLSSCSKENEVALYGEMEGIVVNSETSQPIQGALVTISPVNTSLNTGDDGRFQFKELDPADYTVQVSSNGFETNTKTVTIEPGEIRKVDIQLTSITPIFHISQTSLDFGSNLTMLPVEITNIGKGELEWEVIEDVDWISVNPASGVTQRETDNIIISVDRSNLTAGTYSQNITVTSNGGNSIITINITVQ
ncbi:MAG: carboxypeptidase regulatory-like domain-containing protein [Bacteroidales bacterium]|nr:carboxypeptidase regulatory-like domain-containing protein [Bacteroidales bacterium]